MPLSEQDKERARYHLGYLETSPAASLQLGLPRLSQPAFLVENSFALLIELAVPRVVRTLDIMDRIEAQLVDALKRLKATKLEELTLRGDEHDSLEKEYVRWGLRLANILGCPVYPYSDRYKGLAGTAAGSIPVRH